MCDPAAAAQQGQGMTSQGQGMAPQKELTFHGQPLVRDPNQFPNVAPKLDPVGWPAERIKTGPVIRLNELPLQGQQ